MTNYTRIQPFTFDFSSIQFNKDISTFSLLTTTRRMDEEKYGWSAMFMAYIPLQLTKGHAKFVDIYLNNEH